ncbi:hypothetical protein J437_LFUL006792 [Ladona fulva]|uniref:Structure-specific endonuclease subunit SLX4 n=1 Tax=Ladona fulva TaxID=123851 RepID=A0A8K0JUR4_LADFU|nr:hypothetical protein J437_LFUL006792 [Ladona fulva]
MDSRCDSKRKEAKRSLFTESPLTSKQNKLSCDWIMLVGNPEMSDVKVYTEGEQLIPAHKLVFFARCPLIIKDLVEEEDRGKKSNMLLWVEICYEAAFLFLKHIYGGVFNRSEARIVKVLEDLNSLAERYEVRELLELFKKGDYSKEEDANSLQGVDEIVNNSMACEQNAVEEEESRIAKADELIVKVRDISSCEQFKSDQVSPKIMKDRYSYICDEKDDPAGRIEENDPCHRSEVAYISSNDDMRMNSPSVSVLGRSSPDIFQMTGVADSPESVKVIKVKDPRITQELSQDSRESIEYLVSLMEKDSSFHKSSECDPALGEGDKEKSQEQTSVNSHISESPSLVFKNKTFSDFEDTVPPETPALGKVAKFIISSTPVVQQINIFGESNSTINKDEAASNIEVKRKLQSLDKSDLVSPSPKKIRIEGDSDGKNNEKEVVDLTLSDSEEVAEKISLNDSNCSTLPPPVIDTEEFTPSKDAVPLSPAASPCGGYISNVWDDFDYIPDVPKVDFNDSISASQKNLTNKNEEGCSRKKSVDEEKARTNEIPDFGSHLVDDSPDSIILLDETIPEEDVTSPINSAKDSPKEEEKHHSSPTHLIAGSQEKERDITERLLDASLSQINESVFWRDENEPKEGNEGSVSLAPCHTPVRPDLKAVGSKNETPETPLYTKKANVTPLADYSGMKTPMLHKELDRYGIKHLKRNQAKQLLRHIYNELHPVVSDENESKNSDSSSREKDKLPSTKEKDIKGKDIMEKKKITFESLDSSPEDNNSSSDESSGSNSDFVVLEESIHESQFESPVKSQALSHKGPCVDIPTAMKRLIESDADFHKKILLYEPIWLTDIKAGLKAHGAKFNVKQLMDYLDEQCITFRIQQGNNQRRRKKKKTFSLSQPCNQKRKNKQPISSSQPS